MAAGHRDQRAIDAAGLQHLVDIGMELDAVGQLERRADLFRGLGDRHHLDAFAARKGAQMRLAHAARADKPEPEACHAQKPRAAR
jgi:hypothetical protein